jgi:hypothetical protein
MIMNFYKIFEQCAKDCDLTYTVLQSDMTDRLVYSFGKIVNLYISEYAISCGAPELIPHIQDALFYNNQEYKSVITDLIYNKIKYNINIQDNTHTFEAICLSWLAISPLMSTYRSEFKHYYYKIINECASEYLEAHKDVIDEIIKNKGECR